MENMNAADSGNKTEDDKLVLNVFVRFCDGCKKRGHKAHECPDKKSNKALAASGTGKMTYNHRGKAGHKYNDRWQHEENKGKHPNTY
jgi:hypothetical protein